MTALGRDKTEQAGTLFNNWGLTCWGSRARPSASSAGPSRSAAPTARERASRRCCSPTLPRPARARPAPEAADYCRPRVRERDRPRRRLVVGQSLLVRASHLPRMGDLTRATTCSAELEPRLKRMLPPGTSLSPSSASEQGLLAQARGDDSARSRRRIERSPWPRPARRERLSAGLPPAPIRPRAAGRPLEMPVRRGRALDIEQPDAEPGRPPVGSAAPTWRWAVRCALRASSRGPGRVGGALNHLEPSLGADHPETRQARQLAAPVSVFCLPFTISQVSSKPESGGRRSAVPAGRCRCRPT